MINVLVYVLPNTNSGGLSVVQNLYEDIKIHEEEYQDIHWFFITGVDCFESTTNISVYNEGWALKTYVHRWYYNTVKVKQFIREHDIQTVISLNMGLKNPGTSSIISLHNVLPFYQCGSEVFDSQVDMIKQVIRNRMIVDSLKHADYIIVPSEWIAKRLVKMLGVRKESIRISPISTPEIEHVSTEKEEKSDKKEFVYPSSGFPYKNHKVIVEATKKLKKAGIDNYVVRITGNVGNGKTIKRLKADIVRNNLPIQFSGLLPKEELVRTYKKSILIFPSKIETDAFPLLESMACGGSIIAADLEYAREALKGYGGYELFDPDDAVQLATLMEKKIKNTEVERIERMEDIVIQPRTSVIVPLLHELSSE